MRAVAATMAKASVAISPRGRRRAEDSLTREQIVSVALVLLGKKGLDAFSVRDLAKSLGVYPAAVYWHFSNRSEIYAEVVRHALRDMTPPPVNRDWKAWLRALFIRYRKAVHAHPILAPLLGAKMVSNAGVSPEFIERILGVLADAGFDETNIVEAFNVVIAAKVGFVTLELAPAPEDVPDWEETMKTRINTVNVAEFPLVARYLPKLSNRAFTLRWQNGTKAPLDRSFEAYVDVVIEGLESLLHQNTTRGRATARRATAKKPSAK